MEHPVDVAWFEKAKLLHNEARAAGIIFRRLDFDLNCVDRGILAESNAAHGSLRAARRLGWGRAAR
ncbi:hypothetical protein I546_6972 [Mycobacterium kansasii 732]|nr:hypothetical protein I546_6972 [Mycobacterium kansasii 732]